MSTTPTTGPARVLGIGELLWDIFPGREAPGGAPANVAFHAGLHGLPATVCSRVGTDDLGERLLHFLESHGVDPRHVQRDPTRPTGTVTVDVSDPRSPSFVIHEHVAWDEIEWTPELAKLIADTRVVCFGTLAQRSPTTRATIWRALESLPLGSIGVYDVNLRAPWYQKDWIHRSFELATIIKYNEAEDDVLARLFGLPSESLESNARSLLQRFGAEWVCVTRGAEGSLVVTPDETAHAPGHPVPPAPGADSVGAGDAFTAAIIRAFTDGWPPDAAAELANRAGGIVAAREGAMPDVREMYAAARDDVRARHGIDG